MNIPGLKGLSEKHTTPSRCSSCGWRLRAPAPSRVVRTGCLVVDLDAETVTVSGQEVHLSQREWDVLAYFAERAGQSVRATAMLADTFGNGYSRSNLATIVHRLRRKLGPAARLIITPSAGITSRPTRRLEMVEPDQ